MNVSSEISADPIFNDEDDSIHHPRISAACYLKELPAYQQWHRSLNSDEEFTSDDEKVSLHTPIGIKMMMKINPLKDPALIQILVLNKQEAEDKAVQLKLFPSYALFWDEYLRLSEGVNKLIKCGLQAVIPIC
ncbi:Hypothetical predicted protein [Olea europaea subsp. europaea]|uniref:Uncharacterized protein n=1 Tax=Olea europaea subsp. europaea TaxID=158383 RepID=A0A8S0UH59_OLEEU|nr:Hypothetical predicted protein [Olea europaea subsp. europaea]